MVQPCLSQILAAVLLLVRVVAGLAFEPVFVFSQLHLSLFFFLPFQFAMGSIVPLLLCFLHVFDGLLVLKLSFIIHIFIQLIQ